MKSSLLPPAEHTYFCKKTSRKAVHRDNSYLRVLNDRTNQVVGFFVEHENSKNYPGGGSAAKIKKGFVTPDCSIPKYAVKIYKKHSDLVDVVRELRVAMRAAYCYKQLGREGYAFRRNKKQYLVTEWLPGEDLRFANQKKIQSISVPERIIMAIPLLIELSILHKLGLIHGDIKPENVMISFGKLNLVDMDSVRVKKEKISYNTHVIFTKQYLPNAQMSYDAIHNPEYYLANLNEKADLYAMGLTLMGLFQDIYILKDDSKVIDVQGDSIRHHTFETFSIFHGPQYGKHPELQSLLESMVFQQQGNLKSTEEYIEEMKIIVAKYAGYEQWCLKDPLIDLASNLSSKDGRRAFKEIEIALNRYDNRLDVMNKQGTLNELEPPKNHHSWATFGLFAAAVAAATTTAIVMEGGLNRGATT